MATRPASAQVPAVGEAGVGRQAPDAPATGASTVAQHRVEVAGPNGLVAAGHPLASMAGLRMLMQGGTAADAAVAVMAVLNVVEPWASGAAGNGFATCFEGKTGKITALAFAGAAPRLLEDTASAADLTAGPKAVVTPGAFGGWIELARRYGKLPLSVLLEPAIGYARDGHPLDPSIAQSIVRQQARLTQYPTTAAIYFPGGNPPAARAMFKNLPLARSFQALADAETAAIKGGASRDGGLTAAYDHFYSGPIAREMDRFSRANGGWLRLDDMRSYKPKWVEPVSTNYRGLDVICSPLTSRTGIETCEQLNLLEGFDIGAMPADSPRALHLIAECIKIAKADVYRYAADPASAPAPVSTLISKEFANQRRRLINPARTIPFPAGADIGNARSPVLSFRGGRSVPGDTTNISITDSDGNAIGVTTTLGGGFGANVIMGDTGLFCNNGLREGSTAPYREHPNFVKGGRVPLLGNCPTIVLDKGQFKMVFGTPGGETIGQTQFQYLVNVIDRGLPVQAAIEAPRLALDADPGFYTPGAAITLQLESRFSADSSAGLRAMGHNVRSVGPYAIGSIQAILQSQHGTRLAGSDPRRMGYAVGY
ncbi:gamma-glutamyltransferase family protein [Polymorphobacter multimanifer]|uniref:Gamma-glutamyltranspeptidase/glutathione hydrolase n=1 Tax=Polymorphobacter multimanifer TaxID=1070431 RepID=A0A841LIN8_9SPHN|nr:gamma-glutamyltransferase [Polymorphobacter multimanifer]MBB6229092.1 gamma-glutamyltranspeptidase/glutathione hydrolase [Polymorphobacter multimanifer]